MKKVHKRYDSPEAIETYYRSLIPTITKAARGAGYAIGVHGSLRRDLDLIAAPWTKRALSPEMLVLRIEKAVCKYRFLGTKKNVRREGKRGDKKPHGRISYAIMVGANVYIDLAVMPRI